MFENWFCTYCKTKLANWGLKKLCRNGKNDSSVSGGSLSPTIGQSQQIGLKNIANINIANINIQSEPDYDIKKAKQEDPLLNVIIETNLNYPLDLIKSGKVREALELSERYLNQIEEVNKENDGQQQNDDDRVRSHHQRILFVVATAASYLGDIESGQNFCRRALDLGLINPNLYELAAITFFNVGLINELSELIKKVDHETELYHKLIPLLCFLQEDWQKVDQLLSNVHCADTLLMRVVARLNSIDITDWESVKFTADLLDNTDSDTSLTIINLKRAQLSLDLLKQIINGYTPLNYDREPLIEKLVSRIHLAIDSAEPHSLLKAQAIGVLGTAAAALRDNELKELCERCIEELDDEVRSLSFFLHDPELTHGKIDQLHQEDRVDLTQYAVLKSELYYKSGEIENAGYELRKALFSLPDERERWTLLRLLVVHLSDTDQVEEAHKLIDVFPNRPEDKWILRSELIPKGQQLPLQMIDEGGAYQMNVDVIEKTVHSIFSTVSIKPPEETDVDTDHSVLTEEAVALADRLVKLLPSRSSKFIYAQSLYIAKRYDELLIEIQSLDSVFSKEVTQLKAWAHIGLGHRSEAIDTFIDGAEKFPDEELFVINAAWYLYEDGCFAQVIDILKPYVEANSQSHKILYLYALSIRSENPDSSEKASVAFEILGKAYDIEPDPQIAWEAWLSAKSAHQEKNGKRFLSAVKDNSIIQHVNSSDEIIESIRTSGGKLINFHGNRETLAELFTRDRDRLHYLHKFLNAHVLAYVDFFQLSGRSWELWALWTQNFKKQYSVDPHQSPRFSILSDFPSVNRANDILHGGENPRLLLDQTALLTLGILGPSTSEKILRCLGTSYIDANALENLRQDLQRINSSLLDGSAVDYLNAVEFLENKSNAIIRYSDEIESMSPNHPEIGANRVDLGVTIRNEALYVTDLHIPDELKIYTISSSTLLRSLHASGQITLDQASNAEGKWPNIFKGWQNASVHSINRTLVFDEFSLIDWVKIELIEVFGDQIKIGPWAWTSILKESKRCEALELARTRLVDTIRLVQNSVDQGTLAEIEFKSDAKTDRMGSPEIEEMWSCSLRTLRIAKTNNLQLWADDRFYTLLTRRGDFLKMGPKIESIRESFHTWTDEIPPISTNEILSWLSTYSRIDSNIAEDASAQLFNFGYRMVHPLNLKYTLRQFPFPESDSLSPPFKKLVKGITEIPNYFTRDFKDNYSNSDGLVRAVSMEVTNRLILGVWEAEHLNADQRSALSNAFLSAVEQIFKDFTPQETTGPSDQTQILFWRGVSSTLQMMRTSDQRTFDLRLLALKWLSSAVATRYDQVQDIIPLLEDNLLYLLQHAIKLNRDASLSEIISTFVAPAFIPLVADNRLPSKIDPLLRRTVGTLLGYSDGCRITENHFPTKERIGTPMKISEKEKEDAVAVALKRAFQDDPVCLKFIRSTSVALGYMRQPPQKWLDEGLFENEEIPINVECSMFTILWEAQLDLREPIIRHLIYHLSVIDPHLACKIFSIKDGLLSNDSNRVQEAMERLMIDVLLSEYFDLQRDIVRAIQRFRQYDIEDFIRFLGWMPENSSQELVDYFGHQKPILRYGDMLIPLQCITAQCLLIEAFDDTPTKLSFAEQLLQSSDSSVATDKDLPALAEWISYRAHTVENVADPFVAAWNLHTILLILSQSNVDPNIKINEHEMSALDWVGTYLLMALNPNTNKSTKVEQTMIDRSFLASATFRLSMYVCSGHFLGKSYMKEENPGAVYLYHTWLLASKLHTGLIGLEGGLENAKKSADFAIRSLNIINESPQIDDYFDPSSFGFDGDDIGVALTLMAMIKVINHLPAADKFPVWWTDEVRGSLEKLTDSPTDHSLPNIDRLKNRLGLIFPLRVNILAEKLIKILDN